MWSAVFYPGQLHVTTEIAVHSHHGQTQRQVILHIYYMSWTELEESTTQSPKVCVRRSVYAFMNKTDPLRKKDNSSSAFISLISQNLQHATLDFF